MGSNSRRKKKEYDKQREVEAEKKTYKHVWTLDTSTGEAVCKYCRVMRNLDGSNDDRFCINLYPWERV